MPRHGKYDETRHLILEYLVTATDSGVCLRRELIERLRISPSTATDVIRTLENEGFVKVLKLDYNKLQTIKITKSGRLHYHSILKKQESSVPISVKKYLMARGTKAFFPIQQFFVERDLINKRRNVSVFGYPGCGKTLIAEMVMAKELDIGGRVLYCTPYKALDWQKYNDFKNSFGTFADATIAVADSDGRATATELANSSIIIATFERVLGALRRNEVWLQQTSLVCADEITLLAENERGGVLDTILTLLKNLASRPRIITMSSLIGNAVEFAQWLDADHVIENTPHFNMPIQECIICPENGKFVKWLKNGARQEIQVESDPVKSIIGDNLEANNTTIIFTGMKATTEHIAKSLLELHTFNPELDKRVKQFYSRIKEPTSQIRDLCNILAYGIAYHHAGLQKCVRRFIEDLIREGLLRTIVATTTLSHGIDYQIDCVIIDIDPMLMVKKELPVYEYVNLKGRTGRPGKSKSASVYIVCKRKPEKIFTKYFLSSPEPIYPQSTFSEANISSSLPQYSV